MIAVVRERGGNCIDETGVDQTRNLDQFFSRAIHTDVIAQFRFGR